jgi:hypothetical protein
MSKPLTPAASSAAWLRLYAAVAALPLALVACGGGGGGGSSPPAPTPTPTPSPSPTPMLTVTPTATATTPDGAAITLSAMVTNSTATPTWSLNGAGSLSATTGNSITYTPPDSEIFDANATVTISASLTGAATQTVSIALTPIVVAGLNWTNVTASSVGTLQGVDFADSHYVAVSNQGGALVSADAATWTPVIVLSSTTGTDHFNAMAVTHSGSTFVAAGSISPAPYTTATGSVATSTDGVIWTTASTPALSTPIHGLIAGPHYVGLGETGHIFSSTNGTSWSQVTALTGAGTLNAGVYAASKFVAVGDAGYIAASSDGVTWSYAPVITVGGAGVNLHGIAYSGTLFIAVGDNGTISTSADGSAWSALHTSPVTGTLRSVAVSASGEMVIVGDNGIETSKDGITWTARDEAGAAALFDVAWLNGEFVAVGAASAIKTSNH